LMVHDAISDVLTASKEEFTHGLRKCSRRPTDGAELLIRQICNP
jgi:hypothetical protein